jgi:hypothetical protein
VALLRSEQAVQGERLTAGNAIFVATKPDGMRLDSDT